MDGTVTALTATVMEFPGETTPLCCLIDAHQEAGCSALAATRRANKVARLAARAAQLAEAKELVGGGTATAAKLRTRVRRSVGLERNTAAPIAVVEGDAVPTRSGEEAYNTFRKGGRCKFPGAAIRAGYKVDYHASTLAVTVGGGWVLDNR